MPKLIEVYRERMQFARADLAEMFSLKQPPVRVGLIGLGSGLMAAGLWAMGSTIYLLDSASPGFLEYQSLRGVMLGIQAAFGGGVVCGLTVTNIRDAAMRTAATETWKAASPTLVASLFYVLGLTVLCWLQTIMSHPPLWVMHSALYAANTLAIFGAVCTSMICNPPFRSAK